MFCLYFLFNRTNILGSDLSRHWSHCAPVVIRGAASLLWAVWGDVFDCPLSPQAIRAISPPQSGTQWLPKAWTSGAICDAIISFYNVLFARRDWKRTAWRPSSSVRCHFVWVGLGFRLGHARSSQRCFKKTNLHVLFVVFLQCYICYFKFELDAKEFTELKMSCLKDYVKSNLFLLIFLLATVAMVPWVNYLLKKYSLL